MKQGQKCPGSVVYKKNTLATRIECGAKTFISEKMCYKLRVKNQKYSEIWWGLCLQMEKIILSAVLSTSALMVRVADCYNKKLSKFQQIIVIKDLFHILLNVPCRSIGCTQCKQLSRDSGSLYFFASISSKSLDISPSANR